MRAPRIAASLWAATRVPASSLCQSNGHYARRVTTPQVDPSAPTVAGHRLGVLDSAPTGLADTARKARVTTLSTSAVTDADASPQAPTLATPLPLVLTGHTAGLQCDSCGGTRIVLMPEDGRWRKWMASGASGGGRGNALVLQRMRYLFENHVSPSTNEPLTGKEISQRAAELGYNLSTSYILSLRNGSKTNPSLEALEALAAVFGVEINYFFTADASTKAHKPSAAEEALAAAMRNESVRDIALNAARMTPQTQRTLAKIARELSQLDIIKHGGTPEEKQS